MAGQGISIQEASMGCAGGLIVKPFNAAGGLDSLDKMAARIRQKST